MSSIGAQLITNDQWMTIATNIANQGNNWQGGTRWNKFAQSW